MPPRWLCALGVIVASAAALTVDELRSMSHEELVQLHVRSGASADHHHHLYVPPPPAPPAPTTVLPPGSYQHTCRACSRYGDALWCDCYRNATVGPKGSGSWKQTALSLSACQGGGENASIRVTADGFLSCEWVGAPPPRVGNLTGGDGNATSKCRYFSHTTFMAPQFKSDYDPIATHILEPHGGGSGGGRLGDEPNEEPEAEAAKCCALCRNHTGCKGWTVTNLAPGGDSPWAPPPPPPCTFPPCPYPTKGPRACLLVSQLSTLSPSLSSYSGYPIQGDAASWCQHIPGHWDSHPDRGMPPTVSCGQLIPTSSNGSAAGGGGDAGNASHFPRGWGPTTLGPDGHPTRGTAWLFFPTAAAAAGGGAGQPPPPPPAPRSCICVRKTGADGRPVPGSMNCTGPVFSQAMSEQHIKGKRWAVFVHGGEFAWDTNIDAGYAIMAAQMALGMGILAVDYRTCDLGGENPYPAAINDVIQALEWLELQGAASISLLGDSSGGTQVMQTLLLLAHRRNQGLHTVTIESAVCFSAWLDLTCANPGYRTEQYCTGSCLDMGSPDPGMRTPGWDAVMGQCAARNYAGQLPISHPLLSPVHAGPELLASLPPTLLIVGGVELLMPETLEMAAHAQAAGAPVSARVCEFDNSSFSSSSSFLLSSHLICASACSFITLAAPALSDCLI